MGTHRFLISNSISEIMQVVKQSGGAEGPAVAPRLINVFSDRTFTPHGMSAAL